MRRFATMAVMLVAALPATCKAQFASESSFPESAWKVKFAFFDGKEMEGMMWLVDVRIQAEHGVYVAEPAKVKEIQFDAIKEKPKDDRIDEGPAPAGAMTHYVRNGKLIARSGEEIEGRISLQSQREVKISTDVGFLYPNLRKVKSITFLEKAPD